MTGGVMEQPAPQAALDVPDVPAQGLRPALQLLVGTSDPWHFGSAFWFNTPVYTPGNTCGAQV